MRSVRALTIAVLILPIGIASSHATFSIVAVDPVTGEIGGAGASCISGAFIINDIIEGVGAIHTQAWYTASNQNLARNRMLAGDTPQEILDYVIMWDSGGNPGLRQYGVVDLRLGLPTSAAYTGSSTSAHADHITGQTYAIQGNILLDPATYDVLVEMETAFLASTGPLADRLMAALQAANVAGADRRCLPDSKPSISAFVKVVRLGDGPTPYLELNVSNTIPTENPIDLLQGLYDNWKAGLAGEPDPFTSSVTVASTTLKGDGQDQTTVTVIPRNNAVMDLGPGELVTIALAGGGVLDPVVDNLDGTYTAVFTAGQGSGSGQFTGLVQGQGGPVTLMDQPIVQFLPVSVKKRSSGGGGCALVAGPPMDIYTLWGTLLPFLALAGILHLMRRSSPRPKTA
ncbi:MAG: DUF1028 domain-containing protein [Planctomycetota bacterium]|nr:DUF1028 domain-containing protein [Planctomycetota bacterium]